MKTVLATLIGLVTAMCVSTASAHVIVFTTSIPAATATDDAHLREALTSVIDDATQAVAFTPTVMAVISVRHIGERLYLDLLIADEAGEALIRELEADDAPSASPPTPAPPTDEEYRT